MKIREINRKQNKTFQALSQNKNKRHNVNIFMK